MTNIASYFKHCISTSDFKFLISLWRLEAFEIWIWRRMMKVPWTEHKTNEEILKMVETERKIMDSGHC